MRSWFLLDLSAMSPFSLCSKGTWINDSSIYCIYCTYCYCTQTIQVRRFSTSVLPEFWTEVDEQPGYVRRVRRPHLPPQDQRIPDRQPLKNQHVRGPDSEPPNPRLFPCFIRCLLFIYICIIYVYTCYLSYISLYNHIRPQKG